MVELQGRQVELAVHHGLGNGLRVLARLQDGVADEIEHALVEYALLEEGVHHHIGEGHTIFINAINADKTAEGAFHGHRSVAVHKLLHLVCNGFGQLFGHGNLRKIKS